MSRVGKQPVDIPNGVDVKIEGQTVSVKGPKGELSRQFRDELNIEKTENQVIVTLRKETFSKESQALWGVTRSLIANMIEGVIEGYEKKLEIEGVGYKAAVEGDTLVLNLGFSHPIHIKRSEDIVFSVEKNVITVSGIDKQKVGEFAAQIRSSRPVEPYKGKGIRYEGEVVRRKLGKRAATTAE
ncbi:50S ribosomal protein L6 [Patescibacteria group bacterium]|nr:50S ribosomal protein L6 [Patescibacteria group bacterium]